MADKKQAEILVIHESVLASWLKDAFSFGSIGALLYLNHRYLAGRVILDVLFILIVLVWGMTRKSSSVHTFNSYDDARDYVNSKEFPREKVQYSKD